MKLKIGISIILMKFIIKNIFSKDKDHYPTSLFMYLSEVKSDNFFIKILNKQTNYRYLDKGKKAIIEEA